MNAGIAIRIVADSARPALKAALMDYTPERFAGRAGPKLAELTEEHLAALGGNVKGYPSTRFYEKFARNVRWLPDPRGVAVAILPAVINGRQVGLGLRVFGGTITPQTVSMLAIPISPISYGHVPSDFPGLFLIKTAKGAYLCQRGEGVSEKTGGVIGARRRGGNAGRRIQTNLSFLFKLMRSITQEGNRDVLPADWEYLNTATLALNGGGAN